MQTLAFSRARWSILLQGCSDQIPEEMESPQRPYFLIHSYIFDPLAFKMKSKRMWHWKLPEPFSQITSWILLSCSHHSQRTCNQHSLAVNNSEDVFTDHNGPPPPERGMDSQHPCIWCRAFLVAQTVKNLPAIQEIWIWSLSQEDPLEKGIHSSILAWRIPWTEGSGGLQSMELQRVGHDKQLTHTHKHTHTHVYIVLPPHSWNDFLSFFSAVQDVQS